MTFEKQTRLRYLNKMGMRITRSKIRKLTRQYKRLQKLLKKLVRAVNSETSDVGVFE